MSNKMVKTYLTIDDITSDNTKAIIDYLAQIGVQAVLFAWGERVEANYEAALYALKKGMIIGNHSYSHPHFSELSLEEGIAEIEKCEAILDKLYQDAGVKRVYRPFRFPYGDKGGENKESYQKYFKEHGFSKLDDRGITVYGWKENGLDQDIDTYWTFDFEEYKIRKDSEVTKEDIMARIDAVFTMIENGAVEPESQQLFLLHAHDETEELVPEYYKIFVDEVIKRGVTFVNPAFINE